MEQVRYESESDDEYRKETNRGFESENRKTEEELMMLMEERHSERKEERIKQELYDAYLKNDKSVEEIIQLIENPEILEYLDWT